MVDVLSVLETSFFLALVKLEVFNIGDFSESTRRLLGTARLEAFSLGPNSSKIITSPDGLDSRFLDVDVEDKLESRSSRIETSSGEFDLIKHLCEAKKLAAFSRYFSFEIENFMSGMFEVLQQNWAISNWIRHFSSKSSVCIVSSFSSVW